MNYLQIGGRYINLSQCTSVVIFRYHPDVVFYMVNGEEIRYTKLTEKEKNKIKKILMA